MRDRLASRVALDRRQFFTTLSLALAGSFSHARGVRAQPPIRSQQLFKTDTELVPTSATVRDSDGRLVRGLTRDDFVILETSEPQPITQFTAERVPVSLALVLDVSDSMRGTRIDEARYALLQFVNHLLKPEDETALVLFNHEPRVPAVWTTDREPLRAALGEARPSGGTSIYDALRRALGLFSTRAHPRGAIVLVSDGADTASDTTVIQLKQALGNNDVFLYCIAIDTPGLSPERSINPRVFVELAAQTGGYAEIIRSTADVAPATERIADELNAQYLLGYSPTVRSVPGAVRYRTVRVSVKRDGYRVRARRGVVR